MNCTEFQNHLDDFLDGSLTGLPRDGAVKHLEKCAVCRQAAGEEKTLRAALRELPVEPSSPGFAARALRKAGEAHRRPKRGAFAAGFSSAAAIALVIWGLSGQWLGPAPKSGPAEVHLALAEERQVSLVFEVPSDIRGAKLAMELPAHVELAGYPNQQELLWRTDLAKGRNVLTLPIVGRDRAEGELVARITYGGKEKRFRIRLNVDSPRVWQDTTDERRVS